jgi:hypothetical protein
MPFPQFAQARRLQLQTAPCIPYLYKQPGPTIWAHLKLPHTPTLTRSKPVRGPWSN